MQIPTICLGLGFEFWPQRIRLSVVRGRHHRQPCLVIVDFHLMSIMIICDMPARLGCLCHYGPICTVSALRY